MPVFWKITVYLWYFLRDRFMTEKYIHFKILEILHPRIILWLRNTLISRILRNNERLSNSFYDWKMHSFQDFSWILRNQFLDCRILFMTEKCTHFKILWILEINFWIVEFFFMTEKRTHFELSNSFYCRIFISAN